jgi:ribosome biogenesis GTPase A
MIDTEEIIQWYPGHMAQAFRKIDERMRLCDIIIEVIDARLPDATSNPNLATLSANRPKLIILSRDDLADPQTTKDWIAYLQSNGKRAVAVNAKHPNSLSLAFYHIGLLTGDKRKNLRAMVVGMPNTGKSTVINGLLRRKAAKTEDKPGVTRSLQWFRVTPNLELMDSPGILLPKIEKLEAQWKLAVTGAIPRERFDPETVVAQFHEWLLEQTGGHSHIPDLQTYTQARGYLRQGGEPNMHNAALAYLSDLNEGKFGRLSFEVPQQTASSDAG